MEIKPWVLDRIEQTFVLFKNNFVWLFLPLFLYNFLSIVILGSFSQYYFMSKINSIESVQNSDIFTFLNTPEVVFYIVVWTFIFIIYLLFYIVILLWLLKSIKQTLNNETINISENFYYWISRFYSSMKTYWYIFAYIALITSIIFISWGLIFNISYFYWWIWNLETIWWWLMITGLVLFIVFSLYRGLKSKFAIYSAVDEDIFDKNNFLLSVKSTESNWWRILWNFMLVWIIISLVFWLINWLVSAVFFWISWWQWFLEWLISAYNSNNVDLIKEQINNYLWNFSILSEIFKNLINNILNTLESIFFIVFTYLFFIRLKTELNLKSDTIDKVDDMKNL